jgi:hypothetical protein
VWYGGRCIDLENLLHLLIFRLSVYVMFLWITLLDDDDRASCYVS